MFTGDNDNPSAREFEGIYRKLLVCKEIVYKNNYANCISNDTGVLTVSSARPKPSKADGTPAQSYEIEIEFDYLAAIDEEIDKFDQHLCAYIASSIETKIKDTIEKCSKKECIECICVFAENSKFQDDFIALKSTTKSLHKPCKSTVNIVKATNKILSLLENNRHTALSFTYERTLQTIMSHLLIEELYTESLFDQHLMAEENSGIFTHKENFIRKVINEYMKLKSKKIGNRISEEERGEYIRHKNKKRVHEAGQ